MLCHSLGLGDWVAPVCRDLWMCLIEAVSIVSCLLTRPVGVLLSAVLGPSGASRWSQGRCCHRRLRAVRRIGASTTPCVPGGSRGFRYTWRCTSSVSQKCTLAQVTADAPFRRLALLLDLCEDAFCLVILAMCTRGQLAVTLDLFLAAHIAGLRPVSIVTPPSRLYVPLRSASSLGRPARFGHPYHPVRTCSGEVAMGRIGRCQRCAEAAGSSLAAVHRKSRSVRYSWQREYTDWIVGREWGCRSLLPGVVFCGNVRSRGRSEVSSRPTETGPGRSSAETW